jgi:hypothetical protein
MICEIFQEYLVSLDRIMASKSRKILLFVDHCPAHQKGVRNCKNVQVEFFPANMTSLLQPMDQGVIKALKQKFHRSFILRLLQRLNSNKDSYNMSLLEMLPMLAMAWNLVGKILLPTALGRQDSSQMPNLQYNMKMVMMK